KQKNENSELKEQQLRFVLDGHFQYNVLSSVANQLALKGNWEFARSLGRLGSIQRYSYEKTHARLTMINLREEVNQVESLIDVLRLQYGNNDVVEYVKKGTVDGHKVPPVLLLSFMDNVLKYASVNDTGRSIKIKIDCQDDMFTFVAINKFENKRGFRRSSGIGLSSIQERLVLLDDDPVMLRVLYTYLQTDSRLIVVGTETDSIRALHYMRNNPVDLLISDIVMEGFDGISLIRTIDPRPAVILVTAYGERA